MDAKQYRAARSRTRARKIDSIIPMATAIVLVVIVIVGIAIGLNALKSRISDQLSQLQPSNGGAQIILTSDQR